MPVEDRIYSPCHVTASSDWTAHVERFPTAHIRPIMKRMLVVEGKVTVPSAGYDVSLDLGPLEKLQPRVQQVLVRSSGPDSSEAAAPVVQSVRGVFPARRHYGSIRIRCADGTLAIIPSVADPG
jgi:hypothetical protein